MPLEPAGTRPRIGRIVPKGEPSVTRRPLPRRLGPLPSVQVLRTRFGAGKDRPWRLGGVRLERAKARQAETRPDPGQLERVGRRRPPVVAQQRPLVGIPTVAVKSRSAAALMAGCEHRSPPNATTPERARTKVGVATSPSRPLPSRSAAAHGAAPDGPPVLSSLRDPARRRRPYLPRLRVRRHARRARAPSPEPELPYVDRFRGTEFEGVPVPARGPILTLGRGRVLVAGALLAIVALYGSMVMLADIQARTDRPATQQSRSVTQP